MPCINATDCVADVHMVCCPSTLRAAEHLKEGDQITFSDSRGVIAVAKIGRSIPISRTYALEFGIVEPTEEEQAERDRQRAEVERRRATAAMIIPASIRRLDELDDPTARAVLDLHARRPRYGTHWECAVCLDGGDMGDGITWPCSTVAAVAAVHGIDLTDDWLFERPNDGSLDQGEPA